MQLSPTTEGTTKRQRKDNEKTTKGTQTIKDNKSNKSNKVIDSPYPLTEFCFGKELEDKIHEWLAYKQLEKKEPYKPVGFKNLLTTVKRNTEQYGEKAVINLIEECMANNWKGIIWDRIQQVKQQGKTESTEIGELKQRTAELKAKAEREAEAILRKEVQELFNRK